MKIISLNINDFGGCNEHLEEYKKKFGYQGINKWDALDKRENVQGILDFLKNNKPDIIVLQEFDINSMEAKTFTEEMKRMGYELKSESPSKRPSMTVIFIKNDIIYEKIKTCHVERCLRAYAIKVNDYIIYGTHVPLNSDKRPTIREDYWDEIIDFYDNYKEDKLILLGDFNTYNESSEAYKRYQKLLDHGAYDLWLRQGKPNSTPTELKHRGRLDYIFISPSAEDGVIAMDIDTNTMDKGKISDHAALILELK